MKKNNKTEKSEIFIGLVGATGTNLGDIQKYISQVLAQFGYEIKEVKFSDFFDEKYFKKFNLSINKSSVFDEIFSQMEAGNKVRDESQLSSILARYAIQSVCGKRNRTPGGTAYIFRSLKHPEESKLLSEVYGVGYYQIGVYSSENERVFHLKNKEMDRSQAYTLIDKDIAEEINSGQQTRKTYQLSDFFIKHSYKAKAKTKLQLERIFDLMFGHPHITPSFDEHMMYMAYSFSTRSADLSRQIGAVLTNKERDIIGLGSNDVPRFGGGPYWPGEDDWRDYREGEDTNQKNRNKMIKKIMSKFREDDSEQNLLKDGLVILKDTGILDITEYSRATHAEMAAILSSARIGASPRGGTLFCTTFPCHNCAKHIIESGVMKVLFVEPYPKSQAEELHSDSISLKGINRGKVVFDHFIGVAARRYLDLFSLKLGMGLPVKRKDKQTGKITTFERKNATIRVPLVVISYLDKETLVTSDLK